MSPATALGHIGSGYMQHIILKPGGVPPPWILLHVKPENTDYPAIQLGNQLHAIGRKPREPLSRLLQGLKRELERPRDDIRAGEDLVDSRDVRLFRGSNPNAGHRG